jgi:NADH dehydrogenase
MRRRDDINIDWKRTRVVLIDAADHLLTAFHEEAGKYALNTLAKRGVQIKLNSPVELVGDKRLVLGGGHKGEELKADVIVWAGGVTVNGTLAATLPAKFAKGGRVTVGPDLSLEGHQEISVVGDAAAVPLGPEGGTSPQLAQVAIQSGRFAAEQIVRRQKGLTAEAFKYHDKGQMATIGRKAAVAQLTHGPIIRGFLGWLAWLGLHLIYLMGFRNRVVVLINWAWRYFYWPSGPRLIISDGSDPAAHEPAIADEIPTKTDVSA